MQEPPREHRPGADTAHDIGVRIGAQCCETTIYTYDADRLASIMQLGTAAVTIYRYDSCGEPIDDTPEPAPTAIETPDLNGG